MKFSVLVQRFKQYANRHVAPTCGLALAIALSGCNPSETSPSENGLSKNSTAAHSMQTLPDNSVAADNALGKAANNTPTTSDSKLAPANSANLAADKDTSQPANQPVSYDIQAWEAEITQDSKQTKARDIKALHLDTLPLNRLGSDGIKAIQQIFGQVVTTDENSLDYASNSAVKYRFMPDDKPYLDIIDSQNYVEFGWYYANPSDSANEKQMSIAHAKKVYTMAQALMGKQGGALVAAMLTGQITKNKAVGGQQIELAKCEFYSCMLIIKKPS